MVPLHQNWAHHSLFVRTASKQFPDTSDVHEGNQKNSSDASRIEPPKARRLCPQSKNWMSKSCSLKDGHPGLYKVLMSLCDTLPKRTCWHPDDASGNDGFARTLGLRWPFATSTTGGYPNSRLQEVIVSSFPQDRSESHLIQIETSHYPDQQLQEFSRSDKFPGNAFDAAHLH